MSILVIAEHDNNNLKGATLNTVAAAVQLNKDITLLVAGSDCTSVVTEAQTVDSISKIISVDDGIYKNFIAENLSSLVLSIASGYSHIMAPATTFGKNLLPRISAKLDTQQISDIIRAEYFESDANSWLLDIILTHFREYKTPPSKDVLKVKITEIENDILNKSIRIN